jgi:hypothetical protein
MSRERTEEQLKYHREWSQKWRDENPDKVAKQRRDRQLRRQNDPEYKAHMNAVAARSRYKKRYGMTYDDRDKMLSEQNYKMRHMLETKSNRYRSLSCYWKC